MLLTSTIPSLILLALASTSSTSASPASAPASPTPPPLRGPSIPLLHNKRHHARRTHPDLEVRQAWLKGEILNLKRKYADHLFPEERAQLERDLKEVTKKRGERRRAESSREIAVAKRQSKGEESLIDVGYDASYTGSISVGTPAQNFEVIVDTGSADLWLAGSTCQSATCQGITLFNEGTSSSFQNLNQPFQITYGSGAANGTLGADTVTMAGYTISPQTFAVVTQASEQLLTAPYSGLLGLAWRNLASSGATPFWQALAASGQWTTQAMGFYLARYRDDLTAQAVENQGGLLTLGYLNNSIYTGDVNYISIAANDLDYWRIPVSGARVNNSAVSISLSNGASPEAAIDTGTTLIGVPSSVANALYSAVPNARALNAEGYQGMYEYPCTQTVNLRLQFGSVSYLISNGDFNLGPFTTDSRYCAGAVYVQDLSTASPIQWIVGATFLKNVYSIFQYNPPAIGFAALANSASSATTAAGGASSTIVGSGSTPTPSSARSGALSLSVPSASGLGAMTVALSVLAGSMMLFA